MAPTKLRGRWIAAVARRLVSPESFALLVEPAIADLQLERNGWLAGRVDAYATVWIGLVAACDESLVRRARMFARDHELPTLCGLALLHAAHSGWMVVLLLGLDGRVHLGRMIGRAVSAAPTPAVLAVASVVVLCLAHAIGARLLARRTFVHTSIGTYLAE